MLYVQETEGKIIDYNFKKKEGEFNKFSFFTLALDIIRLKLMKKQTSLKSKRARKRIFIESFIAFLIVISPFIFKLHEYVSSEEGATIEIFGLIIDNNGFPSLASHVWFLLGKFVPLYLLLIWFLTCKHWWYHIILIPLLMYAFQIFEVIYSEDKFVDTENLIWLLPVCMVVIPFVYFIRVKLYDKHVHGIDLEAMDAELKELKEKERQRELKKEEKEQKAS